MYLSFILPTLQDYNYNKPLIDLTKTKILCAFEVIIVCNTQDNAVDFQKNLAIDPRFKIFSCNSDNILELIKFGRLKTSGDTTCVIQNADDLLSLNLEAKVQIIEKEVPVEKVKLVEVTKEIPVEHIKLVEVTKEVPVTKVVEITKEIPVEKIVEVIKEVPVTKVIEATKEVPVEKVVQVIKEVPVEKTESSINIEKPKKLTFKLQAEPPVIDFVFPYVTSDDPYWQILYKANVIDKNSWASGIERFRDSGTLKYLFRSIETNMPWVHRVHMLVSGTSQVPDWVNQNQVNIITHDQFIPLKLLPVFNSTTIEMFLPLLPDVSEKFIYSNDDLFAFKQLEPSYFFRRGYPTYQITLRDILLTAPGDIIRRNCYNLITENSNNTKRVVTTQHGTVSYKKSWIKECYDEYEDKILESCSKFRENKNFNQYMYAFYQMFNKTILNDEKDIACYVTNNRQMSLILDSDFSKNSFVCINDDNSTSKEDWDKILNKLDSYFPNKSRFEL